MADQTPRVIVLECSDCEQESHVAPAAETMSDAEARAAKLLERFRCPACGGKLAGARAYAEERPKLRVIPRKDWRRDGAGVMVTCPSCRTEGRLGDQHSVAEDGQVSPELACPTKGCDFDAGVRLGSWVADHAVVP